MERVCSSGGAGDHSVRLWDVRSGRCLHELHGHSPFVWSICFSPDGEVLASTTGNEGTVRVWDLQSGECLHILYGHLPEVESVCFHPNARLLVSSSSDGTIKLWDVQTGRCLRMMQDDRPYERMDITGVTGLSEVQKATLKALGAIEETASRP